MASSGTERRIARFVGKYSPEMVAPIKAARAAMRSFFPQGFELVYDNYNALVFGFAPTERASDAVASIAAYPRWITLFFLRGVDLPDPENLLEGDGSTVRSIRLESPGDLQLPSVKALLDHVVAAHAGAFAAAPRLITVIKSISAKQRARRPS